MSSNTGDGGVVAGNNSKTKAFSGTVSVFLGGMAGQGMQCE
jgi:hypothetical protein